MVQYIVLALQTNVLKWQLVSSCHDRLKHL